MSTPHKRWLVSLRLGSLGSRSHAEPESPWPAKISRRARGGGESQGTLLVKLPGCRASTGDVVILSNDRMARGSDGRASHGRTGHGTAKHSVH